MCTNAEFDFPVRRPITCSSHERVKVNELLTMEKTGPDEISVVIGKEPLQGLQFDGRLHAEKKGVVFGEDDEYKYLVTNHWIGEGDCRKTVVVGLFHLREPGVDEGTGIWVSEDDGPKSRGSGSMSGRNPGGRRPRAR